MTTDLAALPPHLIRAELLRRSFSDFVSWGWPRVTGKPHVENEMSRRMVAALQRVGDGEQTRTLIAMPPGVGKSVTLALFSAWRFARDPGHRAIHAGHSYEGLAKTESIRVRRLVEHDEYKAMFACRLREDESTAGLWSTTENGIYLRYRGCIFCTLSSPGHAETFNRSSDYWGNYICDWKT